MMEELQACRVCLATDARLFNMYQYRLVSAYEALAGAQVTASDGLPDKICSFCSVLLLKCSMFQQKCRSSQDLLTCAMMHQHLITTDYIRNLDRETHNLTLSYSISSIKNHDVTIKEEDSVHKEDKLPIDNSDSIDIKDVIKFEEETNHESDEEPLSKIVKRNTKKRKKKNKLEEAEVEVSVKDEIENGFESDPEFNFDESFVHNNQDYDYMLENTEVITLTKEQQVAELQERKKSDNYLKSFYKCSFCFKGFMSDTTYKNHMDRHDTAYGRRVCEICQTRWSNGRTLRSHVLSSHSRRYMCKLCDHVCKSSHRAKEHCRWHNGFMYVCEICGASFSRSTSHFTHVRLQHPSSSACELCGESFIGEYGLKLHKKKTHRNAEGPVKAELRCARCGVQFATAAALQRHTGLARGDSCDPVLRPCVFCGEGFPSDDALKEHLKIHQKDESVKCLECDRTFVHARSYAAHYQRVHLGLKGRARRPPGAPRAALDAAVCELCGKQCNSKATLVYHMRTHTGEKPYQCTECPKRFSIHQRLQIHLRTHTGERPFPCPRCPKAFKHKAALNRHDRVHTGVKPYACAHCGKAFSQSNSMKAHVRTVHLKLPAPYRHKRAKEPDHDLNI